MLAFIVRRLLLTLPVVWVVVTLVFGLIHMVPGDPVAQMLGEGASVVEIEGLRHDLGLDRPVLEQYRTYMTGLLHGDLGVSFRNRQTVASSVLERYPATVELAVASMIFSVIVSVPFGVISAVRRGRAADRAISFVSLFGVSLPNFALGPILILFFSIMLGLFPVSGRDGLSHLILPAVTLGGGSAAIMTHCAGFNVGGNRAGLRSYSAGKRTCGECNFVWPRFAERITSSGYFAWPECRSIAGWGSHHGNDLLMARSGQAHDPGNLRARLSTRARLHPGDRVDVHPDQPVHGRCVLGRGSAYPI